MREITVTTEDGLNLHAWYIPAQEDSKPTILFFHGNGGNISHRLWKASTFARNSYGVLLAEYRGYGDNPGKPSEEGLYQDGNAYYKWLQGQGLENDDIILYGESLGTGVAVEMAHRYGAHALILETPYSSLDEAAQRQFFFIPFIRYLMHDTYRSIDKISEISSRSLYLIAGQDEVLGKETGLKLFNSAQEPKTLEFFEQATHNTVYEFGAAEKILAFLK